jgi:hypothetical protein
MELHRLKTLVESKGGIVTDINTDAITCTFPNDKFPFDLKESSHLLASASNQKNINGYYWDELKTIPKYKLEPNAKRVKYPKLVHYMRFDQYVLNTSEWKITPDVPDNNFEPLINKILDSNESWLINVKEAKGRAGTVRFNQMSSNTLYCRVNERMNDEKRRDSCSSSLINFVLNLSKLFLMNCRMSSS